MASLKNRLLKLVFFFVTFYSTFVPDLFFLEHRCSFVNEDGGGNSSVVTIYGIVLWRIGIPDGEARGCQIGVASMVNKRRLFWLRTPCYKTPLELQQRQRNFKKATLGLISKTRILRAQHTILYISLLFLHNHHVKIPNFKCYGGRKQATTNFSFSARNQLQGNSPMLGILSELEQTRQSLRKRDVFAAVAASMLVLSITEIS